VFWVLSSGFGFLSFGSRILGLGCAVLGCRFHIFCLGCWISSVVFGVLVF